MPRRLHVRIALLGSVLLALVIAAHTAYTVIYQTRIETQTIENQAQAFAGQIAIGAAGLLVTRRYSELEELLMRIGSFPDVRRIQVTDDSGRVLSDVIRVDNAKVHPMFEVDRLTTPGDDYSVIKQYENTIVLWQRIDAGALVGWVRLASSLERVEAMRRRVIYNGLLTASLAMAVSLLLFAWFLRKPMRAVARATAFAGQLDTLRGAPFPAERGAQEIEQLGQALNHVSLRLAEQERAIVSAHGRLAAVLEHAIDGIVTVNEDGKIESANPAMDRMFGYRAGELIGRSFSELVPDLLLSDDAHLDDDPAPGVRIELEATGHRHDDSVFPLVVGLRPMQLEGARHYVGIVRDVTQQKQLDRMKEHFVENVSHELRTPLTALHGSLELLATEDMDGLTGEAKNLAQLAYKNSARLVRLINDILSFEDIETGRAPFDVHVVEILPIVRETVTAHQPLARERGVGLVLDSSLSSALCLVDPRWLGRALAALLAHALRQSVAGQIVIVALCRIDSRLRIAVTDHGPGIPQEARRHVFQKFVQVGTSDVHGDTGADVELGLAKTIVEHLGGVIDFVSDPGIVTTFFIDLPEVDSDGNFD
ncbi:MAG TPA: PAS domain S-box protein [Burkholderiales bacterium]|nr:PAS domain S-box protein [Burkholderiales bacterium]